MENNAKIKLAKEALCLLLKSLPEDSYFNIVSFGSRYYPIFKNSQKYTDKNIDNAIHLISKFEANLGGTEIYKPLYDALSKNLSNSWKDNYATPKKGFFENIFKYFRRNKQEKDTLSPQSDDLSLYNLNIILITDGGVWDTDNIVSMIKQFKGDARINTIGIGSRASTYLINEVAKAGDGSSQHILDSKEIKPAVISALKAALMPGFSQIQILNQQSIEVISPKMPFKCHCGCKIACYGIIDNNEALPPSLIVKYVSDLTKTEQIVEIPLNVTEIDQSSAALVMAAGKYFETCSDQDLVSKSIKFQVLSKATAFLGVEKAIIIADREYSGGLGCVQKININKKPKGSSAFSFNFCLFGGTTKKLPKKQNIYLNEKSTRPLCEEENKKIEPDTKEIEDLIALQKADGHWEYSSEVKKLVKRILKKNIENESPEFITALILGIFEEKFKAFENIWCMVAVKSKKWLKKNGFQEIRLIDLGYS